MISVVMTTYNGEKYIIEQLKSLVNQTVKIDEVIISDDGSVDRTVEIVKDYIEQNNLSNWRLMVNKVNKGWRRNFIDATEMARGDLIFFCDQDDIWINSKIERMTEIMYEHHNIDVLAGRYIRFEDILPKTEIKNKGIHPVLMDKQVLNTDMPGCVYCIRSSFWKKIVKYWNGVFSHDAMCWAVAKLLGTAYILEMPVIYWRRHCDSTYATASRAIKQIKSRVEWLKAAQKNIKCLKAIVREEEVSEDVYKKLNRYEQFNLLRIQMLTENKTGLAFKLLKYLDCYNKKRQFCLEIYLSLKKESF